MKLTDLYAELFANWWTDGKIVSSANISPTGIKPAFGRIKTSRYIRKMWTINTIPNHCEYNIVEVIKILMYREFPDVKTFVVTHNVPCKVNNTGDAFQRYMKNAEEKYSMYADMMSKFSEADQEMGKDIRIGAKKYQFRKRDMEKRKAEYDSYYYVNKHQNSDGNFFRTTISIEALFTDEHTMQLYKKRLQEFLKQKSISFREVRQDSSTFLDNYGVAGFLTGKSGAKSVLLSDENLANNSPTRIKGLVGGSGALLGMDFSTNLPLFVNFFESSSAQINLVYGRTGSGKTYVCFQIAMSLIGDGVHCSAIDIKGNEWLKMGAVVPTMVISMGNADSRFVNTLRLDDIAVDSSNCRYYYETAVKGTVELLKIMTNLQPADRCNPTDLDNCLKQAVMKVLSQREVYDNVPDSFKNTEGIKLAEVIGSLQGMASSKAYEKTGKDKVALIACERCSSYLSAEGINAEAFKNEITLGEILDCPMVIYSFDKNSNTVMDIMDAMRVFMVQFLDTKKQSIRKSQAKHSAAFYEELQRCSEFGDLVTYISHSVTGSRSNNVKLFLLINDLSTLNGTALESVKSSVTTKIIGRTNKSDRARLQEAFDCERIIKDIEKLEKKDDIYKHCFVIDYDTGKHRDNTIYQVVLPDDLDKAFRTTDRKEE